MNEFHREIYKTIDILMNQKLKTLKFDTTQRGKVKSLSGAKALVEIDGFEYSCKLRRGIFIAPGDVVLVNFPQNRSFDRYVDAVLGGNETPEGLEISASDLLAKIIQVDGHSSLLDADMLDGKHASDFLLAGALDAIDTSGATVVANINLSSAIIDNKNLSSEVNNAIALRHNHANKTTLDGITSTLLNQWNLAFTHIGDIIKHITAEERALWNTITNKIDSSRVKTDVPADAKFTDTIYTHPETHAADIIVEDTTHRFVTDSEKTNWNEKAEMSDIPTMTSQLENDTNFITQFDLTGAGLGDMLMSVYDKNKNGIVDNADKVNGFTVGIDVPSNAIFTDTIVDISDKVDRSQVLTDVPENAVFTDTIVTEFYHVSDTDTQNKNLLWINTSL